MCFHAITTIIFSYGYNPQHPGGHPDHLRCVFPPHRPREWGGNASIPVSEWTVAGFLGLVGVVLLALPLLSVIFVLGTSAASFFRELSSGTVTWRRIAAIAGLIIQGLVGSVGAVFYSFSFNFGAGYWLALLGCVVMAVGTFLH